MEETWEEHKYLRNWKDEDKGKENCITKKRRDKTSHDHEKKKPIQKLSTRHTHGTYVEINCCKTEERRLRETKQQQLKNNTRKREKYFVDQGGKEERGNKT